MSAPSGNGTKSEQGTVGKKLERLSGVPVSRNVKTLAVLPPTGMKETDIVTVDTHDGIKIIRQIKKADDYLKKVVRLLVFILIFSTVMAIFVYSFGR